MRCGVQTSCLCSRASPLGFSDQRSGSGLLAKFLKRPSKGESVSDVWRACRESPRLLLTVEVEWQRVDLGPYGLLFIESVGAARTFSGKW